MDERYSPAEIRRNLSFKSNIEDIFRREGDMRVYYLYSLFFRQVYYSQTFHLRPF